MFNVSNGQQMARWRMVTVKLCVDRMLVELIAKDLIGRWFRRKDMMVGRVVAMMKLLIVVFFII
jgi:hypothetical protein